MLINDFHIQIATAYPEPQSIDTPKGRTLRALIETEQGQQSAYVKLLNIEDIAKEALCAVLAKRLHLPIKQVYYVNVSNIQGHKIGNVYNIAFGILIDGMPSFRIRSQDPKIEAELLKWDDLLKCAVFDEWVANTDRYPNNLHFEGNGQFWVFDHDETFPAYLSCESSVNAQLLQLKARDRTEFELYKIRDDAMKVVSVYEGIDWNEIYELLLHHELPGGKGHFEKYIRFLRDRLPHLREIITQDLGVRQKEIQFAQKNDKSIESKK